MVAGHLREIRGYYHIVLSYKDENGKRKTPSKSTGLPVKGNKKRAETILLTARQEMEAELKRRMEQKEQTHPNDPSEVLFTAFILEWLEMIKTNIEVTTYSNYCNCIKKRIVPYFDEHHPNLILKSIAPKHIQDYYSYELNELGVCANTVNRRHANIRKALQYAYIIGLINNNPADKVVVPKKMDYVADYYNGQELEQLFQLVKDDPIELAVILAAYYGLRRSEIIGLKWSAIDFEKKTITIRHIVTEANLNGKNFIVEKDRTKTKKSRRSLPLVPPFEKLLLRLKLEQENNKELCGKLYCTTYLEYIYVNELGERIKPSYVTFHFPFLLKKNGMRRIRFHDLRHPYVKHEPKNILSN